MLAKHQHILCTQMLITFWALSNATSSNFNTLYWVNLEKNKFDNYWNDGSIGRVLEIDLDNPDGLYDLHNEYPLGTEKNKSLKRNVV